MTASSPWMRRHDGDAEVDGAALHPQPEAAVLGHPLLGDVELGHDLDAAQDRVVVASCRGARWPGRARRRCGTWPRTSRSLVSRWMSRARRSMAPRMRESTRRTMGLSSGRRGVASGLASRRRPGAAGAGPRWPARGAPRPPRWRLRAAATRLCGAITASTGRASRNSISSRISGSSRSPKARHQRAALPAHGDAAEANQHLEGDLGPERGVLEAALQGAVGEAERRRAGAGPIDLTAIAVPRRPPKRARPRGGECARGSRPAGQRGCGVGPRACISAGPWPGAPTAHPQPVAARSLGKAGAHVRGRLDEVQPGVVRVLAVRALHLPARTSGTISSSHSMRRSLPSGPRGQHCAGLAVGPLEGSAGLRVAREGHRIHHPTLRTVRKVDLDPDLIRSGAVPSRRPSGIAVPGEPGLERSRSRDRCGGWCGSGRGCRRSAHPEKIGTSLPVVGEGPTEVGDADWLQLQAATRNVRAEARTGADLGVGFIEERPSEQDP